MILVLGGTTEGAKVCDWLEGKGIPYYVSVATEYGSKLYERYKENLVQGRMDKEKLEAFVRLNRIQYIIDATHPYAVEVSCNAIACSKVAGAKYVRYERASLLEKIVYEKMVVVDSIEEAIKVTQQMGRRVFLTTGVKTLPIFCESLKAKELVARILPSIESLEIAKKCGIDAGNILALKGPFSTAFNRALYEEYKIEVVVTKESGKEGGFLEKVEAAKECKVPIVVIGRRRVDYPSKVGSIEQLAGVLFK